MRQGNCKTCGIIFEYQPSNSAGLFCSTMCYHKWYKGENHARHKKKVVVICEQCGLSQKTHISTAKTKRFCSRECKETWESENYKGINNPHWTGGAYTEAICQYCDKIFKVAKRVIMRGDGRYCSKACSGSATIMKKIYENLKIRPTKLEIQMNEIIIENKFPFHYVGNGQVWIGGRCPDFINSNGEKKVIEVFGTYWHSPLANPNVNPRVTYDATMQHYCQEGYSCLIIWDKELKEINSVLDKLQHFAIGGN